MTPTFSLITATRDPQRADDCSRWLHAQTGPDVEVIVVDNPGLRTLPEAYSEGLERARGRLACFLHDDVRVLDENWLRALAQPLDDDDCDLVGVAGANRFPLEAAWWKAGKDALRGCVYHGDPSVPAPPSYYGPPDDPARQLSRALVLDGLLLCGRTEGFRREPFDTTLLEGFHFYDSDLCLRWVTRQAARLAVRHGLRVWHRSGGKLNGWGEQRRPFLARHAGLLPLEFPRVEMLRRNVVALADVAPEVAARLTGLRPGGRVLGVRPLLHQGEEVLAVETLEGHVGLRDPLGREVPITGTRPIRLMGVGTGRLIASLLERTRNTATSLDVIEPEPHLLLWLLGRHDWSDAIRQGRLHLGVPRLETPELAAIGLRRLRHRLAREAEPGDVWCLTGSAGLHNDFFTSLQQQVDRWQGTSRYLASRPAGGQESGGDVVVVSPRCPIFDDLAQCLAERGLRTRLLRIADASDGDRPSPAAHRAWLGHVEQLRQAPPRLIVQRNRTLFETSALGERQDVRDLLPVPVIDWWWDLANVATRIEQPSATALPSFAISRAMLPLLPTPARHLPPAARTVFADAEPGLGTAAETIPLSFVGQSRLLALTRHLGTLTAALEASYGRVGKAFALAFERAREVHALHRVLAQHERDVAEVLRTPGGLDESQAYYLRYLMRMAVTAAFRLAAIRSLAPLGVRVYGDEGWLASGVIEPSQYAGPIAPRDLPSLYQRTQVNLNLNFMQVGGTVNPKVLDILAAGGLVVTDLAAEAQELFPTGSSHPLVFRQPAELPDLVRDLLVRGAHGCPPDARDFVRSTHTLRQRAATLADLLDRGG